MVGRWNFLLGWPIFRGYVSFREGMSFWICSATRYNPWKSETDTLSQLENDHISVRTAALNPGIINPSEWLAMEKQLPFWELTYPVKRQLWRWFYFPVVGYVRSLEGILLRRFFISSSASGRLVIDVCGLLLLVDISKVIQSLCNHWFLG